MSINKLHYVLQIADNALILGHRISEWCGHGPVLEQDIAITNTALDHIGQARNLYQYAADLYNQMNAKDKKNAFTYFTLEEDKTATEDTFPYLRDAWDFKNVLLVEQANEDWAYTVARSFFYDSFMLLFYSELSNSNDEQLQSIAIKSLKEVQYHQRWSRDWVIRLGDGTEESHEKMKEAILNLWAFTGELFMPSEADKAMTAEELGVDVSQLRDSWFNMVKDTLTEATLEVPDINAWMHRGGKEGKHTEKLGFILTDMQFLQRSYPDATW
ncbi:MAG TPA: 1,2-phenylacetyl-CoA epoxidase subunit PaaC [Edaphocola sp.]|nr:1,2-phenylacetyl-CoA epoxidase subunit PaaC [Edaphocola sp.]